MEENIERMEQLLSKAGKEPNQEQKKLYYQALYLMLNEEGFSNAAQEYMFKGFRFVKMGPFKAYFVRKNPTEKEELLNQLFKSNILRKDKSRAFTILINLMALFISGNVNPKYCKAVAKEIPNYCYNKEGKILGNANGIMMNNFYSDLTVIPNNYDFADLFDSEKVRAQVEELLSDSVEYAASIRKLTTQQKNAVEMVREWIPESKPLMQKDKTELTHQSTESSHNKSVSQEPEKSSHSHPVTAATSSRQVKSVIKDDSFSVTEISDKENQLNNTRDSQSEADPFIVNRFSFVLEQLLNRMDRLDSAVERSGGNTSALIRSQQAYIDDLKASVQMEKENSGHIRHRNLELAEEVRSLQKKIEGLRKQLVEKDEEARSLNALLEVSSKEGDRKFRGEILKLTEKLRFEYQDYMSAKNIPMSIDLGENMRGQLGDVFDILKKSGLAIDS